MVDYVLVEWKLKPHCDYRSAVHTFIPDPTPAQRSSGILSYSHCFSNGMCTCVYLANVYMYVRIVFLVHFILCVQQNPVVSSGR